MRKYSSREQYKKKKNNVRYTLVYGYPDYKRKHLVTRVTLSRIEVAKRQG